jgi:hypothetical protein
MKDFFSRSDVKLRLKSAIEEHGSQAAFARASGVHKQDVVDPDELKPTIMATAKLVGRLRQINKETV